MTVDQLVTLDVYSGPPRAAADALLADARAVDDEMSFARPQGRTTPSPSSTVEIRTGLHRWTLRAADATRPAGVLTTRSGAAPGTTVIDLVIGPDYRSTGVATAALEQAFTTGLFDRSDTIVACAYGSHPAALRLARRFGARIVAERHHLALPSGSAYRRPVAAGGHRIGATSEWDILGETGVYDIVDGVGVIDLLRPTIESELAVTIDRAVTGLSRAGARSIEAVVDTLDHTAIELLRSAAFGHDRTDALTRIEPRNTP